MHQEINSTEISMVESSRAAKVTALKQLLANNDEYLSENKNDIIEQFGGLRNVLESMLQLEESLNTPRPSESTVTNSVPTNDDSIATPTSKHVSLQKSTRARSSINIDLATALTITIHRSSDVIHSIVERLNFENSDKWFDIADKFSLFVDSKTFISILALTTVCNMSSFVLSNIIFPQISIFTTIVTIFDVIWCCEVICLTLAFDVVVVCEGLKSFDGWYRMYNLCLFYVCLFLLFGITDGNEIAFQLFRWFEFMITTFFIINVDAYAVSRKVSLFVLLIVNVYFGAFTVFFYFTVNVDQTINVFGRQVSMKTVCVNALLNLVVFFVRQLFYKIKYPQLASNIFYSPRLIINKEL